jgi:hypothetical protein
MLCKPTGSFADSSGRARREHDISSIVQATLRRLKREIPGRLETIREPGCSEKLSGKSYAPKKIDDSPALPL